MELELERKKEKLSRQDKFDNEKKIEQEISNNLQQIDLKKTRERLREKLEGDFDYD